MSRFHFSKHASLVIALMLIVGLMLGGCMADTTTKTSGQVKQQMKPSVPNQWKQTTDRLERAAKSVPEVNKATALIVGRTAIVGIDVNKTFKRAKVDNIKLAVARALSKQPYGANAVVTTDADLGQRIMNVRNGMMNGKPFSAFTNELGEIIGRMAPQMAK